MPFGPDPFSSASKVRLQMALFNQLVEALFLLGVPFGFATPPGIMMATEPGKATADKQGEPMVDGAPANMKPLGNVGGRLTLMKPQRHAVIWKNRKWLSRSAI